MHWYDYLASRENQSIINRLDVAGIRLPVELYPLSIGDLHVVHMKLGTES